MGLQIPVVVASTTPPVTIATTTVQVATTTPVIVESIEDKIGRRAKALGLDPVKAQSIAWAESRFNPNAKNASSSASGVFQFLDGTFKEYCIRRYEFATSTSQKNDPDIQIECALRMLEMPGGDRHWWPSEHAWQLYNPVLK
jgi:soluble lytic murein transglycosylase-like protein